MKIKFYIYLSTSASSLPHHLLKPTKKEYFQEFADWPNPTVRQRWVRDRLVDIDTIAFYSLLIIAFIMCLLYVAYIPEYLTVSSRNFLLPVLSFKFLCLLETRKKGNSLKSRWNLLTDFVLLILSIIVSRSTRLYKLGYLPSEASWNLRKYLSKNKNGLI